MTERRELGKNVVLRPFDYAEMTERERPAIGDDERESRCKSGGPTKGDWKGKAGRCRGRNQFCFVFF